MGPKRSRAGACYARLERAVGLQRGTMIGAAFLLLPASMVLLGQYRLTLIKRVATGLGQTTRGPTTTGLTQGNIELDRFCLAPRPRQVRMSWVGRLYVIGIGGATVLGMWLLSFMVQTLVHPPPGAALKLVFGVVVYCGWCWICLAFFHNRIRERKLFVNGEVAMGTVATRTEGGQGAHIVYVF